MKLPVIAAGLFALSGVLAHAADAPPVPEADRAAIQHVIQQQLDAFRRDDGAAAFAEAAPSIQAQFGDAATFMDMVRRGYQPVYHPRSTSFGPVVTQDGRVVQMLDITGPDGGGHQALYFMEHEKDGTWRISGCMLTDRATVGA